MPLPDAHEVGADTGALVPHQAHNPPQSSMQLDHMSLGLTMDAAPWKRVEIDRAKWKVACHMLLATARVTCVQDMGDIMCVEALDGEAAVK